MPFLQAQEQFFAWPCPDKRAQAWLVGQSVELSGGHQREFAEVLEEAKAQGESQQYCGKPAGFADRG